MLQKYYSGSAGIRIVDNARPADDARLPWRIGPDPVVSIGEVTGDESYMLHRANDAATLPDGRIVVANTGTNELRVFDAAGVHLTTWGRAGEGPGEFTALAGVATWPGDSIAAWDARSRVISIFDSGGILGRTFVLESDDRPDEPRLVLGDGTVLGSASRGSGEGYTRAEVTYELRDGRGGVQLSFGDHPGQESFMSTAGPFPTFGFLPFGRTLSEAAWGDLFVIAPNDLYEIRAYDRSDGSLARIVRRDYANRAPTRAEVDEAIDDALARTNLSGQQLEWTRDGYTAMPLVESFPAFRVLLTDDLDHLWVREATLPGMERPAPLWTVFDTEGRALGFIETPADLTILEIGSDYLLGQTTDDLGVETVQVWPLEREPDPGATGDAAAADLFSAWPGDESLQIAAEPSLVVGSDESLPLGRVSGAVFFGDGIAIADAMSYEVLILDAAGRLLTRQGRNGEGPGDYMNLAGIARHADGLITWDAYHFRVTRLDASGGYVGETKLRTRGWVRIEMVGAIGNSVLHDIRHSGFPGGGAVEPMEIRLPVAYEIARLSDGEVVFEDTRPGREEWAARESDGVGGYVHGGQPVIFGRTAVSAVTDRYAYLATTDSITITRYDEAGTAVEVSFEQPRESAEAAWVRFLSDSTRAYLESKGPGQMVIAGRNFLEVITEFSLGLLEDLPARPTLPAFSAMKGGADGLLWIREYPDPFQDQVAWVGFNEAWERKKRIAMPASLHVLDISEDRVLVKARGAHDETLIKVYPIER